MSRFKKSHWSWKTRDGHVVVEYMAMDGRVTVEDLMDHMRSIDPGIAEKDVLINFGTVKWERPATTEELADRAQRRAVADNKAAEWELKTLARLKEKYEGSGS